MGKTRKAPEPITKFSNHVHLSVSNLTELPNLVEMIRLECAYNKHPDNTTKVTFYKPKLIR